MELKSEDYLSLSSVIILLLVLMLLITNLVFVIRKTSDKEGLNLKEAEKTLIKRDETYNFDLVLDKNSLVIDSMEKSKLAYRQLDSLVAEKDFSNNVIIDSSKLTGPKDAQVIKKLIRDKKTLIFLNMPDKDFIEKNGLKKSLGLAYIGETISQEELNIVPGFMLGGLHEVKDIVYESSNLRLLATAKIYAYGSESLPVIWRNTYKESEIYLINGPPMESNLAYGLMTALLSEIYEDYIYPVVNTRLMVYEGLPYVSYEKKEKFEEIYSRDPMKTQQDIILPDILSFSKRRDFIPNGYFQINLKNESLENINEYTCEQVNNFKSQIYKAGGDLGISYSGDINYDIEKFKEVFPDEKLGSVLASKEENNLKEILEASEGLTSIVGLWNNLNSFSFLNEKTVYIPITASSELDLISAVTAFGAEVNNLSLEDLITLKDNKENWRKMSKDYVQDIDDYRIKYDFLENRSIEEASKAVKIFNNTSPEIQQNKEEISLHFKDWYGESFYILKTDKKIVRVINGQIEKIEEGAYLLKAQGKDVLVKLKEVDR